MKNTTCYSHSIFFYNFLATTRKSLSTTKTSSNERHEGIISELNPSYLVGVQIIQMINELRRNEMMKGTFRAQRDAGFCINARADVAERLTPRLARKQRQGKRQGEIEREKEIHVLDSWIKSY